MTWRQSPSIATVETILLHVLIFIGTGMAIKYCGELDLGGVSWVYRIYYDYASRTMNGEVPYRDFLVEYPVLSFPLFALPRLLFADFRLYCIAFAAEMLLFDIAAIILIARYIAMHEGVEFVFKRLMWYSVYSACLSILVVGRFELAPMVLAFAASSWLFRGRNALGGFVAGLGTLTKLFPCLIMGPAHHLGVVTLQCIPREGPLCFRRHGPSGCRVLVLFRGAGNAGLYSISLRARPGDRIALCRSPPSRRKNPGD